MGNHRIKNLSDFWEVLQWDPHPVGIPTPIQATELSCFVITFHVSAHSGQDHRKTGRCDGLT